MGESCEISMCFQCIVNTYRIINLSVVLLVYSMIYYIQLHYILQISTSVSAPLVCGVQSVLMK